jgi:uncharacterized membrane protein
MEKYISAVLATLFLIGAIFFSLGMSGFVVFVIYKEFEFLELSLNSFLGFAVSSILYIVLLIIKRDAGSL